MTGRAVVVGAGAIGVASAYFLVRSGFDVTLVDRGEVGHGCSYGNACLIVPSHSDPIPGPGVIGQALRWMVRHDSPFYIRSRFDPSLVAWGWKFRRYCNREAVQRGYAALAGLSRGSLALYDELTSAKEADFFFEKRGLLEVYLTPNSVKRGRSELDLLTQNGFPARLVTANEARELEPALSPAICGGLFIESEAHGHCYGYVRALAGSVQESGGRVVTGRPIERIVVSNRRVQGISLGDPPEEIAADVVVLAAGCWSRSIAQSIGIDIPLQPAKGYSATIDAFEGGPRIPLLVKEHRVIVTPLDGRLRFGGTLELAGYDLGIDQARYRAVVRAGLKVLRDKPPMKNEASWCGLRPVTPDGLPIIDRLREPQGLILATGHAMLGFTQSPMTGKLVAELARGDRPSLSLEPFRLDRF
ncbi:MAG TPA: FAD-dependent oxidoreductase [Vicinamibacteria bacterium]|nr:FAD-dependent oxidoreductase [Vicinamibacteria bacterium]